ncbi:MAG: hypothetical protein ACK56I_30060, partial [bacterium]
RGVIAADLGRSHRARWTCSPDRGVDRNGRCPQSTAGGFREVGRVANQRPATSGHGLADGGLGQADGCARQAGDCGRHPEQRRQVGSFIPAGSDARQPGSVEP